MAANLDFTNGHPACAIAHDGEIPWHGSYNRVDEIWTPADWQTAGGLDWQAIKANCYAEFEHPETGELMKIENPNRKMLLRSDNYGYLDTVSNMYKPHQPAEILDMFFEVCHGLGFKPSTMGSLSAGTKIYMQAITPEDFCIPGDDQPTKEFLTIATSFNKTIATQAWYAMMRVVCENTLAVARGEKGAKVTLSHRGEFDAQMIKDALGLSAAAAEQYNKQCAELVSMEFTADTAEEFFLDLLQDQAFKWDQETMRSEEVERDGKSLALGLDLGLEPSDKFIQIADCYTNGPGQNQTSCYVRQTLNGPVKTAYAALNAVTDYADHHISGKAENCTASAMFGTGDDLKTAAF